MAEMWIAVMDHIMNENELDFFRNELLIPTEDIFEM
jgi:hypothetical protein